MYFAAISTGRGRPAIAALRDQAKSAPQTAHSDHASRQRRQASPVFFARVRGRRDHPDSERGHPRRVVELVPGKGKSATERNELIFIIQTNKRRILSEIHTCYNINNIALDKFNLLFGK